VGGQPGPDTAAATAAAADGATTTGQEAPATVSADAEQREKADAGADAAASGAKVPAADGGVGAQAAEPPAEQANADEEEEEEEDEDEEEVLREEIKSLQGVQQELQERSNDLVSQKQQVRGYEDTSRSTVALMRAPSHAVCWHAADPERCVCVLVQEAAIKEQLRAALGSGVAALAGSSAGNDGAGPNRAADAGAHAAELGTAGASAATAPADASVQDLGVISSKRVRSAASGSSHRALFTAPHARWPCAARTVAQHMHGGRTLCCARQAQL
jgi:hypothetical protein